MRHSVCTYIYMYSYVSLLTIEFLIFENLKYDTVIATIKKNKTKNRRWTYEYHVMCTFNVQTFLAHQCRRAFDMRLKIRRYVSEQFHGRVSVYAGARACVRVCA